MKRMLYVAVAAAALTAVAACQRDESGAGTEAGQADAVNAVQDAASPVVGQMSAATLGANTTGGYVTNAAIGDMYEIEAGRMAQERGQAPGVKEFGQMLVTDHTAASERLRTAAQAAQAEIPTAMDQRRQGMIDNLRAAQGAQFDTVFLTQQVAAHQENLTLQRGYAENGDNEQLKAHAAQAAPTIQRHLERAQQLQQQAGGQGGSGGSGGGQGGGQGGGNNPG